MMKQVGGEDSKCVPFVSQYSDCTDSNSCGGCVRCTCNATGNWECQDVFECPQEEGSNLVDDVILDKAADVLYENLDEKMEPKKATPQSFVPPPPSSDEDLLLVPDRQAEIEREIRERMGRRKRSVNKDNQNATVKFYETIDEINEDTLKDLNSTGTIKAHKFNAREVGQISRRALIRENNDTLANDLHIEYSKPHDIEHHIAENKVDSVHPTEDKINGLNHEEIHKILGNYSQIIKNKELSQLVVNELSRGSERIGDKTVIPVSNITFTPENDTLTAMTFIAGSLLNKLWDMEKDANEGSYETELMKHEKINDLLELFKEPLSMRQENFLKNALEQLARAVNTNKDIKNVSICAKIEESVKIQPEKSNCTEKSTPVKEQKLSVGDTTIKTTKYENQNKAITTAINKINDVLNLMKKYEHLQTKLTDITPNLPESKVNRSRVTSGRNISANENVSLNLFGKVLEKITNLLSPNKNDKNVNKKLQTYNMLRKDDVAKKNLEKIFNMKLGNVAMGAKDRIITDYLSNIEKHPNCFFSHLKEPVVTPFSNIEGSILYNLSEFFKIKSFTDLLSIVNDKNDNTMEQHNNKNIFKLNSTNPTTTEKSKTTMSMLRINPKSKSPKTNTQPLASVNEKLKNDIKQILQDLIDLQKEHGIKTKKNINIADVLPCIYNILKSDSENTYDNTKSNSESSPKSKISSFIESLKKDTKTIPFSRRSNTDISPRPKSAIVWERTIQNLNKKYQKASRRFSGEIPKTYEELREMMSRVESSANTYKYFAIQSGVAPSERLMLLKILETDVKQYINVLEAIKNSFTSIMNLPTDKKNEFNEFIDNSVMNINLNKKIVSLISKLKVKRSENRIKKVNNDSHQPLIMIPKWLAANENKNIKLNRDQIMNQLIMNRLKLYIKTKERSEVHLGANANYNIARRILFHLENGNIDLAKDLYKVFLANKQQYTSGELNKFTGFHEKESIEIHDKPQSRVPKFLSYTEPTFKDDDVAKIKMLTRDYFLKQLWNLKELKE